MLCQTILKTKPSFCFEADKTYVIGGGLGGLGRSIATWMVGRGARNLILLSRSGARDQRTIAFLRTLAVEGARVETPACDMTDASALKLVLDHFAKIMPPVMGCIQASMVLRVSHLLCPFSVQVFAQRELGRSIRQHVLRRLESRHQRKDTLVVEPAHALVKEHGLFRPAFFHQWHDRTRRASQLRRREHI